PDDDDVHGFSLRRHDPHQVWRSALMPSQPRSEAPANFLYSMTMTTDIPPHTDVSESLRASRQARLARASLYLCTDARSAQGDLAEFLDAAYAGGVDIIQLRDKTLEARAEIAALEVLKDAAGRHGKLFSVNDRADVALLTGADVFHVGQGDLTSAQARAVLGDDVILGRSTHSRDQALAAEADGEIDYFCVGPVWQNPTKPGRRAVGTQLLTEVAAEAGKPWFAIAGVAAGPRRDESREAGARRAERGRAVDPAGRGPPAADRSGGRGGQTLVRHRRDRGRRPPRRDPGSGRETRRGSACDNLGRRSRRGRTGPEGGTGMTGSVDSEPTILIAGA